MHDGEVAFVVDPQRDIDRVLALLDEHGVRLTHVFETHIHNDYVTGGLALAQRTGAAYLVNGADDVSFDRTPVADGAGRRGRVAGCASPRWRPPATRSPTSPTRSTDTDAAGDRTVGVFSGGSLLYGATGRPDLLGAEHTHDLVRHQHASAHRLAELLPDDAEVFPTHGFGSFCSATQSDATSSTIGQEKRSNPVLTQDEETYVRELLAGLGAYPAYYAHMAPANAAGPSAPDLSAPAEADAAELRRRIEAGEWVVDLRNRTAFAAGHVPGTLNFGLDGGFATYLGWLIAWGTPVTLLGETAEDVAEAQRELVRIGIDRPAAAGHRHARRTGAGPASRQLVPDRDVRRPGPGAAPPRGRRARRAPHRRARRPPASTAPSTSRSTSCPAALAEVPAGEVWVHCAGGYRASVAASLLDAAGRTLVAVDDSFDNAEKVGLHLVGPERRMTLARSPSSPACSSACRLGALGGGGSILAVPVLVYALGPDRRAGHHRLARRGRADLAGRGRSPPTGPGTCCSAAASRSGPWPSAAPRPGPRLSGLVPEPVLLAAFAVLLLVVASVMAVRQLRRPHAATRRRGARDARLDDPIITLQPDVRLPVPARPQGARHRHRRSACSPGSSASAAASSSYPPSCSLSASRWSTPPARPWSSSPSPRRPRSPSAPGPASTPTGASSPLLTGAAVVGGFLGARVAARVDTRRLQAAFTVLAARWSPATPPPRPCPPWSDPPATLTARPHPRPSVTHQRSNRRRTTMCRPVTCKTCGKTTWAGCGQHVAQVKAAVPAGSWCAGHPKAERTGGGWFGRLTGRG